MSRLETENRILGVIAKSSEPVVTTEVSKKLKIDRNVVEAILVRLVSKGVIKGRQTKKRGPWIWWLPTSFTLEELPRKGGESDLHLYLKKSSAEYYAKQGYFIEFEKELAGGVTMDVLATKDGTRIGIECVSEPSLSVIIKKCKSYLPYVNKLVIAVAGGCISLEKMKVPKYVEIFEIPVPEALLPEKTEEEADNVVIVSLKGQVTIPIQLREKYRIKEGAKLLISDAGGEGFILKPLTPLEDMAGIDAGKISIKKAMEMVDKARAGDRY